MPHPGFDLSGQRALVTGSTQGIGRSIAEAFAAAGCHVVLHGLARDRGAEEAVAACSARGVMAEFVAEDLAAQTMPAVERLVDTALAKMPGIDILVNNAGTYCDLPFLEMDHETYERTMRLNVAAPYFLTQRLARRWVQQQVPGRVLMIGSINGRLAEPTHTCYDTSKGAIDAMVRSLCVSLAPHKIRVNGLAPGLVRTPLTSIIDRDERVICILTGHQLKDPKATVAYHTTDQDEFNRVLGSRGVRRATFANRAVAVQNDLDEIIRAIQMYA